MEQKPRKSLPVRILKWVGILVGSLILLLIVIWLALQTQWAQNILRTQAVAYLHKKLKTEVSIDKIHINWLYNLEIDGVTLLDQQKQPLLQLGKMEVSYRLLDLMKNEISVSKLELDKLNVNVYRSANDSAFNFTFIANAFSDSNAKPKPVDTLSNGAALRYNLGILNLTNIHLTYNDAYTGQSYDISFKKLSTDIQRFSLDSQEYKLAYLLSEDLTAKIIFGQNNHPTPKDTSTSTSKLPLIQVGALDLQNTYALYQDGPGNLYDSTVANKIGFSDVVLDLNKKNMKVKDVLLKDHFTAFRSKPEVAVAKKIDTATIKAVAPADPFTFSIQSVAITGNGFSFDNLNTVYRPARAINFDHLKLTDFDAIIKNINYDGENYVANIGSVKAKEQSGLALRQLKGDMTFGGKGFSFKNAVLTLNRTNVNANISGSYTSLDDLSKNIGNLGIDAILSNSTLNLNDMLFFQPALASNEYVKPLLTKNITISSTVKGKVNDLHIQQLQIREGSTVLDASAYVTGLPDVNKLRIDLKLNRFSGTKAGILALLPKGTVPADTPIPDNFSLTGTYKGSLENMVVDMNLRSSLGDASVKGFVKNLKNKRTATYNATVSSGNLRLDKILKDTSFGAASFSFTATGSALDPKFAKTSFAGNLKRLRMKGYTYHDMRLTGTLANQLLKAHLNSIDSNLNAKIDLAYSLDKSRPSLVASSNVMYINFKELGFTPQDVKMRGQLNANLTNTNPDSLLGTIELTSLQISNGPQLIPLDTVSINATRQGSESVLSLSSPFLVANLRGQYKLTKLATAGMMVFNHYYAPDSVRATKAFAMKNAADSGYANATLTGTIYNGKLIQTFAPDLKQMTNINFSGRLNTAENILQFKAGTKQVTYGEFAVDSFALVLDTRNDSLTYNVSIQDMRHPSFPLDKTFIYGGFNDGNIAWNMRLLDSADHDRYFVGGSYVTQGTEASLHILPELLLNRQRWNANADNVIRFLNGGIAGGNLNLTNNGSGLSITSASGQNGLPVNIRFSNFTISTITKIIGKDSTMADGIINGTATITNSSPVFFTSDLTIDSLKSYNQSLGQLHIKAHSSEKDVYALNAILSGNQNDVEVDGTYSMGNTPGMNIKANIRQLHLAGLQPLASKYVSRMNGDIAGEFNITGTPAEPNVRGELNFKEASIVYAAYNTYVRFPNEKIVFDEQGILFKQFVLTDSLENEVVIDGRIATTNYKNFKLGLNVDANHFLAVNKRVNNDQKYFGPAYITAALTVKGDQNLPRIDGTVKLDDKSEFTMILPSPDPSIEQRNGIIEFVDVDNPADSNLVKNYIDTTQGTEVKGFAMSLQLAVTDASSVTVFLDENNGDYLKVRGAANLTASIDPGGTFTMTGRYVATDGEYQLSINDFIKRKFTLQKGGTITWDGNPTRATVDLAAIYNVQTSAAELFRTTQSSTNDVRYRQKLPFLVYLNIKGQMMKPAISFKLDMPEADQDVFEGSVYSRLQVINNDPSELNKQVIGLLVLNNFISDNPLNSLSGNGSNTSTMVKQTAGKLLSQQLNNLASNLIKGVDINFDLESKEDYTTGTQMNQTNLNVGLSKNLFNDRTVVYIGSSVPLEGSSQAASGLAGNVSVEYKLTKDGRYRIRVYRRNQTEFAIEGQIVETGAGFTLVMDYNHFREIFQKPKELKVERRRQKAKQQ